MRKKMNFHIFYNENGYHLEDYILDILRFEEEGINGE